MGDGTTAVCTAGPYMFSGENAALLVGLTVSEFWHMEDLLDLPSFYAGKRHYFRRSVLVNMAERLFAENEELETRFGGLSEEVFWAKYDEKYDSGTKREAGIKKNIRAAMWEHHISDIAHSMNFGNSMDMFGNLSDLEKARIVDVFLALDMLTAMGKVFHARMQPHLEARKGKKS